MATKLSRRTSVVSRSLASQRLGVPPVLFFMLCAAAPFTVVAGAVTTAFQVTGVVGIPLAFLLVAVALAVFSVGYVAMSRRVVNAGAFYTYISRGLGRPAGVGAAMVALLTYNALQISLYGGLGVTLSTLLDTKLGWSLPWWVCALVAWAAVGVLGVLHVDLNGRVLAVLLVAEIVVVLLFDGVELAHPFGGHVTTATLSPHNLFVPGFGAALVLAVTGFTGFEQAPIFSEEARNPRRTVAVATYAAVAFIAVLYAGSSWAMSVATGPGYIVKRASEESTELIFNLGAPYLGPVVVDIAHVLFCTSLFAALISFHNAAARYGFALGRERVLPEAFGHTSRHTGAPKVSSLAQTGLALAVIVVYLLTGADPLVKLFFWGGMWGGFGALLLIAATSVSVIAYFARNRGQENLWRRAIAPGLATVALLGVLYAALANFATLLGVPPASSLRWALPLVYAVAVAGGVGWALVLRARRPAVYQGIGLGVYSVTGETEPHPEEAEGVGR